jgi:alcohol dehydrogenase
LKSTLHGLVSVDTAAVIVNEITLVGSRCGRFEAALPLLDHELIHVEEPIVARCALAEAPRAFARGGAGSAEGAVEIGRALRCEGP